MRKLISTVGAWIAKIESWWAFGLLMMGTGLFAWLGSYWHAMASQGLAAVVLIALVCSSVLITALSLAYIAISRYFRSSRSAMATVYEALAKDPYVAQLGQEMLSRLSNLENDVNELRLANSHSALTFQLAQIGAHRQALHEQLHEIEEYDRKVGQSGRVLVAIPFTSKPNLLDDESIRYAISERCKKLEQEAKNIDDWMNYGFRSKHDYMSHQRAHIYIEEWRQGINDRMTELDRKERAVNLALKKLHLGKIDPVASDRPKTLYKKHR